MFDEIVTEFAQNAIESSGEVEDYILNLEQNGYSEEILRKIKLILHSIKGSAGSYGFATSSSICHKMEDLVSTIAPGNIDPDLIVRLLKFKDILVESFKNMGQDQSLTNEIKQQIEGLNLEKNSIGLSAMVVGTSRSIDMIITKTLKDHGISTTTSRDCYEALGHLINDNFDFLFTSYEMPKFTGDKLIKAYQTLFPESNLISFLLTSNQSISDIKNINILLKDKNIGENISKSVKKILDTMIKSHGHEDAEMVLNKVVHIDDDPYVQKLVALGIKKYSPTENYQSTEASDTLPLCIEHQPDVILLDFHVGDTEGSEIKKELYNSDKVRHIPVIFMTGEENPKKLDEINQLGCAGIIKKPFKPIALKKTITEILRDHQQKKAS